MVAQWFDWHLLVIKMGDTSTNTVSGALLPAVPPPQAGAGSYAWRKPAAGLFTLPHSWSLGSGTYRKEENSP